MFHACLMVMSMQISAVWAVGLAEGASHVNWRRILNIVCWWIGSLIPVFLVAAAMVAQGMLPCPFARASPQGVRQTASWSPYTTCSDSATASSWRNKRLVMKIGLFLRCQLADMHLLLAYQSSCCTIMHLTQIALL